MKQRDTKTKLLILYFLIYGSMACFSPFLSIYMQNRNFSFTEMGMIYAVNSLVAVICQPVWGYVTDRYLNKKKTLMITMIGSSIFILPFIIAKNFYAVFMMTAVYTLFSSSISSVTDACCYEIIEEKKEIQYGKVRLMGSIGYAVVALFLGMLIKKLNVNVPFILYAVLLLPGVYIIKALKMKSRRRMQIVNLNDLMELFKNKGFTLFIFSVLIINICMNVNGNYIVVLIQKTGGDVSNLGVLWFVIAMSELPILTFGSKIIEKYGVMTIFSASMIFYLIRFLLDSICTNYVAVIAVQIMQGITFPIYLIAALEYINEVVPPRMRTSGMTLYSALGCGLGGFIGNIGGGIILDKTDIFSLYKVIAFICVLAIFTVYLLKNTGNNNKKLEKV